jgi:hypothetical protein
LLIANLMESPGQYRYQVLPWTLHEIKVPVCCGLFV